MSQKRELLNEEERAVLDRLDMTEGEITAVGEVELAQRLWPMEADVAMHKEGGERSKEMEALRRRVRKIIESLRVGFRCAILDTSKGYFYPADSREVEKCCGTRHKRAMKSLVIESIIRKGQPLKDGVQMFMEFLKSHEDSRRRQAKREGFEHRPIDPAEIVRAVEAQAFELIPDSDGGSS